MPKGFTLVEVLVDLFLFSAIAVAIFGSLVFLQRSINLAKMKIWAGELANKQIEIYRNMPYDSLATQSGAIYPPGNIPDNQTINVGNIPFNAQTIINFVDDPFDGDSGGTIQGKPQDFYSYDYKKVEVRITTPNNQTVLSNLTTNVAAKAAETSSNTGILYVKVLNAQGSPFTNAQVSITNSYPDPDVNIQTFTDSQGLVVIPRLPPDTNNHYHVLATAPGNSTDSTNLITAQYLYPVQPDVNILVQQVTQQTLSIDLLGGVIFRTLNVSDLPLANVPLTVTSGKLTYTNPDVYKYQQVFSSDGSGEININDLEWDGYSLTTGGGYIISSVAPYQPVPVAPGEHTDATVYLTTSTTAPTLFSTSPLSATNNSSLTVTFTGNQFALSGAAAVMSVEVTPTPIYDSTDIVGTSISVTADKTEMTATFDFTNKQPGTWQIKITNPNSEFVKQPEGFTVTTP